MINEEEQEQLLAEVLRENRELEVTNHKLIRKQWWFNIHVLKSLGEEPPTAKANRRDSRNLLKLPGAATFLRRESYVGCCGTMRNDWLTKVKC